MSLCCNSNVNNWSITVNTGSWSEKNARQELKNGILIVVGYSFRGFSPYVWYDWNSISICRSLRDNDGDSYGSFSIC